VDVLFAGTFLAPRRWRRLPWLARLAALADGRRVVLRHSVPRAEYLNLLRRAKVVFDHANHGECNRRAFEAAAAGALLLQEADNAEVPHFLSPATEYATYTDRNLEEVVEHFLSHEDERQAVAQAGHQRVQGYGCDVLWGEALALLQTQWRSIEERCRARRERGVRPDLTTRVWLAAVSPVGEDHSLRDDLILQP
jgi:hypothetical protein